MPDNSGYVNTDDPEYLRAREFIVRPEDNDNVDPSALQAVADFAAAAGDASKAFAKVANAAQAGGARKQIPSRRKSQTKGIRKSKKN
jgi:hypothetical protein